jgi:hypothetical protein
MNESQPSFGEGVTTLMSKKEACETVTCETVISMNRGSYQPLNDSGISASILHSLCCVLSKLFAWSTISDARISVMIRPKPRPSDQTTQAPTRCDPVSHASSAGKVHTQLYREIHTDGTSIESQRLSA